VHIHTREVRLRRLNGKRDTIILFDRGGDVPKTERNVFMCTRERKRETCIAQLSPFTDASGRVVLHISDSLFSYFSSKEFLSAAAAATTLVGFHAVPVKMSRTGRASNRSIGTLSLSPRAARLVSN
jgi:hypothetical protein